MTTRMNGSWPCHSRGAWSDSISGEFSGNVDVIEGQARADLERGLFWRSVCTTSPPGLLDDTSSWLSHFSCI